MTLRDIIKDSGKTVTQIAAESGVSRQTVNMVMDGHLPRIEVAAKLAMAIGCSVYDVRQDLRGKLK